MMHGLLLMALIETARVKCRNAWVIMITACSHLSCSLIFMPHMDFLASLQCKPGWLLYNHTHALYTCARTPIRARQRHGTLLTPNWISVTQIHTQKLFGIYRRARKQDFQADMQVSDQSYQVSIITFSSYQHQFIACLHCGGKTAS